MPDVLLKTGTKITVSGHPATLSIDSVVDFTDLPNEQAVVESLQNDPHNFGLNKDLYIPVAVETEAPAEPWITYDDETDTVSAPGHKMEPVEVQADVSEPVETIELTVDEPEPPKPEPKKKPTKRASSKPVSVKTEKTATKKGSKKQ